MLMNGATARRRLTELSKEAVQPTMPYYGLFDTPIIIIIFPGPHHQIRRPPSFCQNSIRSVDREFPPASLSRRHPTLTLCQYALDILSITSSTLNQFHSTAKNPDPMQENARYSHTINSQLSCQSHPHVVQPIEKSEM